ncbi:MAG TPA: glycogen synthesis protein GlgS [Buttiauxella sp.]|nr:glycogen synthesis protein GlgS [Buttiauxella sp.]
MNKRVYAVENLDFLARSFAHMHARGRDIDINAVTGNMSEEQKVWFQEHYDRYYVQAVSAGTQIIEH